MPTLSAVPISIDALLLTTAYQVLYQVPGSVHSGTIRGVVICNVGAGTTQRVWLHKVPPAGTPGIDNALLYDQEFIDGIDGDGVLTLEPGESLQGKADALNAVTISASGAESVLA
jgi:hypothetical protein